MNQGNPSRNQSLPTEYPTEPSCAHGDGGYDLLCMQARMHAARLVHLTDHCYLDASRSSHRYVGLLSTVGDDP